MHSVFRYTRLEMLHELALLTFVAFSIISGQDSPSLGAHSDHTPGDVGLEPAHRQKRFFPLFSVVRFPNSQCMGLDNLNGTCFTKRECAIQGGTASGTCANGFGVCCVFRKTCGSTSSINNTYFTDPRFTTTYPGGERCTINIQKCNSNVCQLRLDFLEFCLAPPAADGMCDLDVLLVTGGSSAVPRICGDNADQHVYVDFEGSNVITISIDTNAEYVMKRRWNIRIQQIACDSPWRAPSGCLQYFQSLSGTVMSFNYGTTNNQRVDPNAPTVIGTREMINLNYGVCIKKAAGYCSLRWSESATNSFSVTGDASNPAVAGTAMSGDTVCTTDYITIPNTGVADRFCGTAFTTLTTTSLPFTLYVVTDDTETSAAGVMDIANKGFSLMFKQMICSI